MKQDIYFHVIWLEYTLNIYNFLLCCCVVCRKAMLYEHSWETFLYFGMISFCVLFGWIWWITPIYRLAQCFGPETLLTGQFYRTFFNCLPASVCTPVPYLPLLFQGVSASDLPTKSISLIPTKDPGTNLFDCWTNLNSHPGHVKLLSRWSIMCVFSKW